MALHQRLAQKDEVYHKGGAPLYNEIKPRSRTNPDETPFLTKRRLLHHIEVSFARNSKSEGGYPSFRTELCSSLI